MPRIDNAAYEQAEERQAGGFQQPTPGAYELRIQTVRTQWEEMDFQAGLHVPKNADGENAVLFVYDIDAGEFAGEYSREFYMSGDRLDPNKDFMHQVKYTWGDLGRLKLFNRVLAACNPGFDPLAAMQADQWQMFVGKRFGAVLNGTVTTNDNGFDNWKLRCGDIVTVEDVRTGNHAEPKITDKRKKGATAPAPRAAAQTAPDPYGDIPL